LKPKISISVNLDTQHFLKYAMARANGARSKTF
jgi:hypothetical protein